MPHRVLSICVPLTLLLAALVPAVRANRPDEPEKYPWQPLKTVSLPAVPAVKNSSWVRNPIDAFIAVEHESRGLVPRPEASKHVLLRRVYLDLIGLPPTPEELHAFLDDISPDAFEKVVDRLLASPRYGERWGRHWMDVWRYSDWAGWTGGNQIRDSQPHVWRWRDWIIESLNADKGYDRMILEMLAADELAPTDKDALRATGFLVRNYKMLSRETWLQDTVNHTSKAFLGVTMECCRCHDHQYDPITQREYYQFRAFFEPHQVRLDRLPGEADTKKDGLARAFDADPGVPTFLFVRGDDRNPDKEHPLVPGVPAALGGVKLDVQPVPLPLVAAVPEKQDYVIAETVAASEQAVAKARAALDAAKSKLGEIAPAAPDESRRAADRAVADADAELDVAEAKHTALVATLRVERLEDAAACDKNSDEFRQAATEASAVQRWAALVDARRNQSLAERIAERADAASTAAAKQAAEKPDDAKIAAAAKKAEADLVAARAKLGETETPLAKAKLDAIVPPTVAYTKRTLATYPATSTGRRLALARWIASRENPLTARVAANHIWLRHMGTALVPSVFDFGKNGKQPTHPALLDWLASELMQSADAQPSTLNAQPASWSMKHLHRLIVTSATYRMASTPDDANLAADPDNRFFWRTNSRRVEAELVRDAVLYVAGQLDLTMGGSDIDHALGLTSKRRSLYFRHAAEKQMEFLKLFDAAAVTECYERKESIVPQQALALANSELALVQSRLLARSLSKSFGAAGASAPPSEFVIAGFERVLSRRPTADETEACVRFLADQTSYFTSHPPAAGSSAADDADATKPAADPALRAREDLVHALLNHNDFVTVR